MIIHALCTLCDHYNVVVSVYLSSYSYYRSLAPSNVYVVPTYYTFMLIEAANWKWWNSCKVFNGGHTLLLYCVIKLYSEANTKVRQSCISGFMSKVHAACQLVSMWLFFMISCMQIGYQHLYFRMTFSFLLLCKQSPVTVMTYGISLMAFVVTVYRPHTWYENIVTR